MVKYFFSFDYFIMEMINFKVPIIPGRDSDFLVLKTNLQKNFYRIF